MLPDHVFAEIFDRAPVALVVRSLETEAFVAVNRAYEALTGYRREELIGKTPDELRMFDSIPHHELNIQEVVRTGWISDRIGALRTKAGDAVKVVFSSARMLVGGELVVVSVLRAVE